MPRSNGVAFGENGSTTNDEASRRTRFLVAYDAQLRTDAETPDAIGVTRLGPLRLVIFAGGRHFISYHDRGDVTTGAVRRLVPEALGFTSPTPTSSGLSGKRAVCSRVPFLNGSGLIAVSTTTPYNWKR